MTGNIYIVTFSGDSVLVEELFLLLFHLSMIILRFSGVNGEELPVAPGEDVRAPRTDHGFDISNVTI